MVKEPPGAAPQDEARKSGAGKQRPAVPLMFRQVLDTTVVRLQNSTDRNRSEAVAFRNASKDRLWPIAASCHRRRNTQSEYLSLRFLNAGFVPSRM